MPSCQKTGKTGLTRPGRIDQVRDSEEDYRDLINLVIKNWRTVCPPVLVIFQIDRFSVTELECMERP